MTVEADNDIRLAYTGAGTTGPFTTPYFLADGDIKAVKVLISDGTETLLILTTDYSLTGAGDEDGGSLTLVSTLSSSYRLVIINEAVDSQTAEYPRNDAFPSATHQAVVDRRTLVSQRTRDLIDRSLRQPDGDSANIDALPPKVERASKALGFDADGDPMAIDPASAVTASENVTFVQSGSGAIATSVGTKLNEQVTVMDRMTDAEKADARARTLANDLRAAVAQALSTATSPRGAVGVPSGSYKMLTGITMPTLVDLCGESRLSSILRFGLTASGTCVNMEGADTSNRVRSSLRRLRIDGEDSSDANVIGVSLDWNQQQNPVLDEVTIYGGYQAGGATTGLKNGLVFKASGNDGSNWTASINELGIEGCHSDALVMNTISGGAHNIINYFGGRVENNKGRNVVLIGPNDDIASFQINFYGLTFQGASYGTTGVASSVHVQGVQAHFDKCWFEANATPNWATHEIRLENGRLSLHDCHIAWAQRGLFVQNGTAVLSGHNTIRSSTAGIVIGGNGRLVIRGEVEFLGAGTPIQLTDETSVIDWVRNRKVDKTASYGMSSSDIGSTISNFGTKANITVTMALCPTGATLKVLNSLTSIRNSTYRWLASGSGTNEFYLDLAAGGNPGFSEPNKFYDFATSRVKGTLGALAASEWGYGDNDTLGYSTIYYRTPSGADPDAATAGTLTVTYTVTITPTNGQRLPLPATSPSDSIVSDGVPGTCMEMVLHAGTSSSGFWTATNANGTWA